MTVAIPVSKAGGTVTSATMRLIAFINSAQLMLCDRTGKMRLVKVSTSNPSLHDICFPFASVFFMSFTRVISASFVYSQRGVAA